MTLIEVLVALVIFSLGMLGAGGLILSSLRSSQYTNNASIAMSLARDYGEAMQMIPPTVAASSESGTNLFVIDTDSALTTPSAWCKSADCTPTQLIGVNAWEWAQRVKTALPGGRAVVCKDTTPKGNDGLYQWDCDNAGNLLVVKFGWNAKTGPAGTGDDNLKAVDANNVVRPKLVITLFGNQEELESLGSP
jgi:type IV pilus assembly protein PilV